MAKSDTVMAIPAAAIPITELEENACSRVVAFEEWGQNLPIGLWINGQREQSFELNKADGRLYRQIQTVIESSRTVWAEAMLKILPKIVVSIGGVPIREIARSFGGDQVEPDVERVFRKMYYADVIYLLYCARVLNVGGRIELQWTCEANPNHKNKDNAKTGECHDLTYSEVTVFHERYVTEPVFAVSVPSGALTIENTPISVVNLRPLRFEDVLKFGKQKDRNKESFTVSIMQACVTALPEHELYANMRGLVLGSEVIDQVKDVGFMNRLEDAISSIQKLGPDTTFEVECNTCGHQQEIGIPYTELGSFLTRSARPA